MANEIVSFNKTQIKVKFTSYEYANDLLCPFPVKTIFRMICIFDIHTLLLSETLVVNTIIG